MKTLVLGANGHIGANLVRGLLLRGREVRGLIRPTGDLRALRGLDLELVEGDVRDRPSIERALQGCDRVYHLAAPTIETPQVAEIALEGTRNVLELARRCGHVERLVYTSSVVTLSYTADPQVPVTESSFQAGDVTPYQAAKFAAEAWLRKFVAEGKGPEVVVVKPTTTLGPLDYRPTPANRTVVEFMKKGSPITFEAGLTIADVEDVARGHVLAEERGRSGEDYVLGGQPIRIADLFDTLARLLGIAPPRVRLPRGLMILGAAGLQAIAAITGRPALMTVRQARHFVGRYGFYSSEKARAGIGYTYRPVEDTLRRTIRWFLSTDLISAPRRASLARRMADA